MRYIIDDDGEAKVCHPSLLLKLCLCSAALGISATCMCSYSPVPKANCIQAVANSLKGVCSM